MITISEIKKTISGGLARIEADLTITEKSGDEQIFPLYVETSEEWGKYFVTDRADAFVVGVLNYAMCNGHDITCQQPISSELKFLLERHLIYTLCKNEERYYKTGIFAEVTDEAIINEGAVGTGISLGLDSFCTIAEHYQCNSKNLRLTHLVTLQNGAFGGYYQKNNWDYCASKLYEQIQKVSKELNLPLITVNSNLHKLMQARTDYFLTYWTALNVMSLGKLFSTYFFSSNGTGYSKFDVSNRFNKDCTFYDLLSLNTFSIQRGGVRFLSGGGAFDRLDKIRIISEFPIAANNLQSCLTEHFNCMHCLKCKRNLVTMDALGVLDKFNNAYDIQFYRENRDMYMEWMCSQVNNGKHDADFIRGSYELIKAREPEYIERFERDPDKLITDFIEVKRQRKVYASYASMFRNFILEPDCVNKLKTWFGSKNIHDIICYGSGASEGIKFLNSMQEKLGIKILYIVEDVKVQKKGMISRLPENTIDYPACDAVIICNIDKTETIRKKLSELVSVPLYDIKEILSLK